MPLHNEDEIGRPVSGTKIAEIVAPGITALSQIKRLFVTMFATIRSLTVGTVNASSPGPGNLRVQNDTVTSKLRVQNDATVEGDFTVRGQIFSPEMDLQFYNKAYFTFTKGEVSPLSSSGVGFWLKPGKIPMLRSGQITGLAVVMRTLVEPTPNSPQYWKFNTGFTMPPPHTGPDNISVVGAHPGGWNHPRLIQLSTELGSRAEGGDNMEPEFGGTDAAQEGRTSNWVHREPNYTITQGWTLGSSTWGAPNTYKNGFVAGSDIKVRGMYFSRPAGEPPPTITDVVAIVEVSYGAPAGPYNPDIHVHAQHEQQEPGSH